MNKIIIVLMSSLLVFACKSSYTDIEIGQCWMRKNTVSPNNIIKVIGIDSKEIKYFSHFLSDGRLIQAEDYQSKTVEEVKNNYMKIDCPKIDGTFSPDKYINKNK